MTGRYARKVDANQAAVVAELRAAGCFVEPALFRIGGGCPDLLVGFRGRWVVVELKDPAQSPSRRRLTNDESDWIARASLHGPVIVATTAEEILEAFAPDAFIGLGGLS